MWPQDFIAFIMSADGQAVVERQRVHRRRRCGRPLYGFQWRQSGKVVVAGSSSVTPVMEKLAEAYKALNPEVTIEVNQSDSTTGVNMATMAPATSAWSPASSRTPRPAPR